ncbi:hypothetical protein AWN76_009550 [Rhodothermaceae bacterium RA]|nr:hypothetical protein AWN76_009550 [Rhodothermaceae bacterium RA]
MEHTMRKITLFTLLVATLVALGGCRDLTVENLNEPDRERALAEDGDLVSLLQGATTNTIYELNNLWGVHMGGLSDQMTSTNRYLSFWSFTDEPRERLNNRTTFADAVIFNAPWSTFNGTVSSANEIIRAIEVDGRTIEVDGEDLTQRMLASAYFIRGVARGYVGLIYDQGYLVDIDTDLASLQPVPYTDLIAAAVEDLNTAIAAADAAGASFLWDLLPGDNSYDLAEFKEIAHSFAAKILINQARTNAEAAGLPWAQILQHANNGIGTALPSFSPASSAAAGFSSNYADWSTYVLGDGAGYLPTDIKVAHLLDPSYPVEYPTQDGVVLDPAVSDDPRLAYFNYTPNFGFLNAARRRALFSNYWNLRMSAGNNWFRSDGYGVPVITGSEMQYIKAEAHLWQGDKAAAAQALNNSPHGSVPTKLEHPLPAVTEGILANAGIDFGGADGLAAGFTLTGAESDAEFIRILHKEYSVELDLMGSIGIQWFFMRRHDLLQPGTALHYAIPGEELEISGIPYYTFGGADYAGEPGTASGDNNWKTFDARNGLSPASKHAARHQLNSATYGPARIETVPPRSSFYGPDGRMKGRQ